MAQAIDELKKLSKGRTQEAREAKLKLETLKTHLENAQKLEASIEAAEQEMSKIRNEIRLLQSEQKVRVVYLNTLICSVLIDFVVLSMLLVVLKKLAVF